VSNLPPSRPLPPPPPLPARASQPPARATLGRVGGYELLLELAAGGMAMVFLGYATDGRSAAPLVAIKRPHRHLASDKTFLSMLLDEARLASSIEHENVVKVRELGFHVGEPFIVMDYVEGASLSELRKELAALERAVETKVAVRIVLDALAGLHAAHELRDESGRSLGIIHRDVSPHNVLIGCDGRARLTDFGIAKAEDRLQVTRTHEVKGKLAYLAPERIDRRRICTKQSDVFSMAVVLWECIAGRRLFRGEEAVDTLQEVMHAPIPRLRQLGATVPPALDDVIARGLSRVLETRFQTAASFAQAIEGAAGRGNTGSATDVARMIETIFGPRMAVRHEQVRAAMRDVAAADRLFEVSSLPRRAKPTSAQPQSTLALIASIAPPAPSARYSFGKGNADYGRLATKRTRWGILGGTAVGLAVGAMITLALAAQRKGAPNTEPIVIASAPAALTLSTPTEPTSRRVVVPLPFLATHVALDDLDRDVSPPSDVCVFDIPHEAGIVHRVAVTALDGTRAEGFVREMDGVARADQGGFVISETPKVSPSAAAAKPSPPRAVPIGTVRNGFTKLR
jgi:serine/threonine protein kinase